MPSGIRNGAISVSPTPPPIIIESLLSSSGISFPKRSWAASMLSTCSPAPAPTANVPVPPHPTTLPVAVSALPVDASPLPVAASPFAARAAPPTPGIRKVAKEPNALPTP